MSTKTGPKSGAKNLLLHRLNKATKKWRSAFVTIYCSRALENLLQQPQKKFNRVSSDSEPDRFITDIHRDHPYSIVQATLADLVKHKNINQVTELGGSLGIARSLNVDFRQGINPENAEDMKQRISAFGTNTYAKPPENGFFHFVRESFQNLIIFILLICAVLSLGLGIKSHGAKEGWYEGGSIFAAIFLVVSVSSVSNFRQSRQFSKLSKVSLNIPVEVVRNGRRQRVSLFDIVVGDVICLKKGDQVPADGVFLEGYFLRVDESSVTGESDHLEVNHGQNPFLISGTKVSHGHGQMIVTSVGMQTTWREMMSSVSQDSDEKTPLQSRIDKLAIGISKVGLLVAFVALSVRYFIGNTKDKDGKKEFNCSSFDDVISGVLRLVSVAIPEGLPLAVTLTLVYSMKRMMSDQAMVRKLSACETMGSATIICTDKTGTLTLNKMKVTKFWLGRDSMEAYDEIAVNVVKFLHQAVGMNTTANVSRSEHGEFEFPGSPTEKAIISWAVSKFDMDMERVKEDHSLLQVEMFNSEKKRSGVMLRKNSDSSVHVHWKGAAEMILGMCSHYYDSDGEVSVLDKVNFLKMIEGMASSSLRCIAFAHKQVSASNVGEIEKNLVLLGILGLKDPCRPGVKKSVEDCQNAGVKIKMITGDDVFTARAIAVECGILPGVPANLTGNLEDNYLVVEGSEFRNYTDEERMAKVEKIAVMARSSPSDKLLMVKCLRQKGHVVAVTGDGINDAPALKEADIGLSMGIQGTQVAKESCDIVILDDDFTTISTVLRWGRCVYENIQKFIQFQLTVNVAALVINFVAAVSAVEVPLSAVQLLWVNLIMDTLGALALATERPTMKELIYRPPIDRSQPLVTNIMWRNLLSQAVYQITIILTMQFKGEGIFGVNKKVNETLIFNTFVLCQVFNEFNARKLEKKNVFEGILKNRMFIGIVAGTVVLQVVMVEFLKQFANTERLDWGQWGVCIGLAVASWPIGWVVKCIPVPEKPFFS